MTKLEKDQRMRQRSTFDQTTPRLSLPQRTIPVHSTQTSPRIDCPAEPPKNSPFRREENLWGDASQSHLQYRPQWQGQKSIKGRPEQPTPGFAPLIGPLDVPKPSAPADLQLIPAVTLPLHAVRGPQHRTPNKPSSRLTVLKLSIAGTVLFTVLAATLATAGGGKGVTAFLSVFYNPPEPSGAAAAVVARQPIAERVSPIIQAYTDVGYDSAQQHDVWWDSVCSAASFTAVARAWGVGNVTIGHVLDRLLDHSPPYITTYGGLMSQDGWPWMAEAYHLQAQVAWHAFTFDTLVQQVTSTGIPIVIGMEGGDTNNPWGHFVVVTGGDSTQVTIADSSLWKMKSLPRSFFSRPTYGIINDPIWWSGETVVITPM
jgi:Peptidase_C39 like family